MSRQINIGNIGWYLLQAQEGSLNAQEMDALCAFLEEHPELVPETEPILVESNNTEFNSTFTYLKKDDYELSAFDTLAVSVLEGERREKELMEVLAHRADLQAQWRAFKLTLLKPDAVTFSAKRTLYQKRVQPIWIRYAAAACIVAMLSGWVWNNFNVQVQEKQQAVNGNQLPVVKDAVPAQIDSSQTPVLPQDQNQRAESFRHLLRQPNLKQIVSENAPEKQLAELEIIHGQNNPILSSTLTAPELILFSSELLLLPSAENAAITESDGSRKGLAVFIRNVFSGRDKSTSADWINALASAGNEGLEQISKGRIEFSHQPENEKGPDTYLKIGNFSITRSLTSN